MKPSSDLAPSRLSDVIAQLRKTLQQRYDILRDSAEKSHVLARGIYESAIDAIVVVDRLGTIVSLNAAAEAMFCCQAAHVVGENLETLVIERVLPELEGIRANDLIGERLVKSLDLVARRKSGTTFPVSISVSRQWTEGRLLYTCFIRDLTERRRLEAEIVQSAEREQQRIGQELHDGLGQHLTGIAFLAKSLAAKLAKKKLPVAKDAEKICDLISEAIGETRSISHGLQPLDCAEGLDAALELLCTSVRDVFSITCTLQREEAVLVGDVTKATHLYRIAQEAVHNAVRHGKARHITIRLRRTGKFLHLGIEDDGGGFTSKPGVGIGLRTMFHRAKSIGAALQIGPSDAGGIVVDCYLELDTH